MLGLRGIEWKHKMSLNPFLIYCDDRIDKTFIKTFIEVVILIHSAFPIFIFYSCTWLWVSVAWRILVKEALLKLVKKKKKPYWFFLKHFPNIFTIKSVREKSFQIAQVHSSLKAHWKLCRIILIRLDDCARLQTSGYSVVTSAKQCVHCALEFNSF